MKLFKLKSKEDLGFLEIKETALLVSEQYYGEKLVKH